MEGILRSQKNKETHKLNFMFPALPPLFHIGIVGLFWSFVLLNIYTALWTFCLLNCQKLWNWDLSSLRSQTQTFDTSSTGALIFSYFFKFFRLVFSFREPKSPITCILKRRNQIFKLFVANIGLAARAAECPQCLKCPERCRDTHLTSCFWSCRGFMSLVVWSDQKQKPKNLNYSGLADA